MLHSSNNPNGCSHRRVIRNVGYITSKSNDFVVSKEHITEFFDDSSIETTESTISKIENGEKITSHLQVAGECTPCGCLVTHHSLEFCSCCGISLCRRCREHLEKEDTAEKEYYCKPCHKKAIRKLRWQAFRMVIFNFFFKPCEE